MTVHETLTHRIVRWTLALVIVLGTVAWAVRSLRPQPAPPAPKEFMGKGVWIWQISKTEGGNPEKIAERAATAHLDHVLIKVHDRKSSKDGSLWYNPWGKVLAVATALHKKGIKVFGWGFVYGDDIKNETAWAINILNNPVFDGYVWDVEGQFTFKHYAALDLCRAVRKHRDAHCPTKLLGYSTFCRVDKQTDSRIPYSAFGEASDVAMPQAYWGTFNWEPGKTAEHMCNVWSQMQQRWLEDGKGNSVKPIIPTGHAYRKTRSTEYIPSREVKQFADAVNGYYGVNFWAWEFMAPEHWKVLTEIPGSAARWQAKLKREKPERHAPRTLDLFPLILLIWVMSMLITWMRRGRPAVRPTWWVESEEEETPPPAPEPELDTRPAPLEAPRAGSLERLSMWLTEPIPRPQTQPLRRQGWLARLWRWLTEPIPRP